MFFLAKSYATLARRASEGNAFIPRWRVGLVLVGGLALFAAVLLFPSTALAQKTLRWKFKPGDELGVKIEQRTVSTVSFGSKSAKTTLEMTLETLWKAEAADEK